MATVVVISEAEVLALRTLVGSTSLSNERLSEILATTLDNDGSPNIQRAASVVWHTKASEYADLVDTSESGSTRKLSDLHKNALTMARHYDTLAAGVAPVATAGRSRTRAIRRAE